MQPSRILFPALLLALGAGILRAADPPVAPATLVTEPRAHDPCMIREGRTYYVYSTGRGIQAKRSTDLLHWQILPNVFPRTPAWATPDFPRAYSIWAPDISFFNNQYHLYYCVSNFGKNRSAIGFATSPTLDPDRPDYHWTDHGKVLESFPTDNFNAIDPSIILDTANTPWLVFGSFWDGIKLRRLSSATGLPDPADPKLYSLATRPQSAGRAIEAPCIIHRGNFYYLIVSFDLCCRGVNSTYHMMMGRSKTVTGPYLDQTGKDMRDGGGSSLLANDPTGRIRGPGGGIALHDGDRWLLVHHFYDANDRGIAKLQIRPLVWSPDNWPIAGAPLTEAAK